MHIHKHNIGRRRRRRRRRSCGNSYKVHHSWPGNGFIFPHSVPFPPLPTFLWIDSITMILYSAESPHVYSISRKIGSTYLPSSIRFIKFLKYSTVQEIQFNSKSSTKVNSSHKLTNYNPSTLPDSCHSFHLLHLLLINWFSRGNNGERARPVLPAEKQLKILVDCLQYGGRHFSLTLMAFKFSVLNSRVTGCRHEIRSNCWFVSLIRATIPLISYDVLKSTFDGLKRNFVHPLIHHVTDGNFLIIPSNSWAAHPCSVLFSWSQPAPIQ